MITGLTLAGWVHTSFAQDADESPRELTTMTLSEELRGTVRAPEFPAGDQWLNTDHPLTLKELKGKIVLLDFWTYCCINCMHVIPDLKRLEEKYKDQLVVIGVHSAKFKTEKDTDNIRQAVLRYEVHHPVINDSDFQVWSGYGIRAWPSFALIDPEGKVVGITSGEGIYETMDPIISELADYYKKEGKLNLKPFHYALEKDKQPQSILSFPGKIAADEKSDTLVISDSNHNRIVIADLDGQIRQVIGSGAEGFQDGDFQTAQFFRPQGVFWDAPNQIIYVADTENHAIRKIDLEKKTVETLAGSGHQARAYNLEGPANKIDLNSPWDLLKKGDLLYIAMAGSHQIWTLDLKTGDAKVFAGSAREDIIDGPLKKAALAQTSGLTTDGNFIYSVDSETSSLRQIDFNPTGSVKTLVGKGLFDFGDTDGPAAQALFQHPIGVAYHEGLLYVADTYNNQVRLYDLKNRTVKTLLGGPEAGFQDGDAAQSLFNEPCGLAFAGDRLFITDTNNNVVRIYDLKTRKVSTLILKNLAQMNPVVGKTKTAIQISGQEISASVKELRFTLKLANGLELNAQAPSQLELSSDDPAILQSASVSVPLTSKTVDIPVTLHPGQTNITLNLTLYYCSHGQEALCYFKEASLDVPVTVSEKGNPSFEVHYTIP